MERNQRRQAKGEMECNGLQDHEINSIERTPIVPLFPVGRSQAKCKRREETVHFNAGSSSPELLMRTILGRRCIQANQILILTCLSTNLRHE